MIRKLTVILLAGVICVLGVTSVWAAKYNEAPMLRAKVAAGELPPVEERLPEEPVVVQVVEEIGQYGGTINVVTTGVEDAQDGYMMTGLDSILRVAPDGKTIVPNLAKSWEFSEGGKALTLHLIEGIKWSDGVPFTADDILFWYEDIILNDELTPVKPGDWSPGGELMKMEKLDDYTIRLRFAKPHPLAPLVLAHIAGTTGEFFTPKHIMKEFHPRYVPKEKLEKLAKEEGNDFWYQSFQARNHFDFGNLQKKVDAPTIDAFLLKEKKAGEWIFERNPYYWKVDTAGNQLPYVDRVHISLVESPEMVNMKILTGEVDFSGYHTTLMNYPLYMENADKGGYRVLMWKSGLSAEVVFFLNLTHKDPVFRKIVQDRRFRIAMSLALNREEINDMVLLGRGIPAQGTALPNSSFYEERFSKAYAEYDSKEANRLLDEMGLDKRDNQGYRLRPDGKRLSIVIEFTDTEGPKGAIAEVAATHWEAIGIQIILKEEGIDLMVERVTGNETDMGLWHMGSTSDVRLPIAPVWFVPMMTFNWGIEWAQWYTTKGEKGEEPPEEIKKLHEWFDKLIVAMDEEERIRLMKNILESQAENVWSIGTVAQAPVPIIVKNNLRNIPEEGYWGWDWLYMYIAHPEQFFIKK